MKVIPQVTGKAKNGAVSSGIAQFDFGGSTRAPRPSLTARSSGTPRSIPALNSPTVRASAAGSTPMPAASSSRAAASTTDAPGMSYSSLRSCGRVVASNSWKATPPGWARIRAPYLA